MTERNGEKAQSTSVAMSSGPSLHVCFMPRRDISLRALLRGLLFTTGYSIAAAILLFYVHFRLHGTWFYVALLGQLVLHFYLTTEILISRDEVERLAGYGLMRREGLVRFCGYAPGRRRLRTLGLPIRSVEEANSEVLVHLSDGSQVRLPKLSLEGQRLFKSVFESIGAGADAKGLKEQYTALGPGLLVTLEYKEAPLEAEFAYAQRRSQSRCHVWHQPRRREVGRHPEAQQAAVFKELFARHLRRR